MERRGLVGRRYEDFINNNIHFELTEEEKRWVSLFTDQRYSSLIDRRKTARRKVDAEAKPAINFLKSECSLMWIENAVDEFILINS